MSDHAPPMNDQTKIWIRTWRTYWRMPPIGRNGPRASSARSAAPTTHPDLIRAVQKAGRTEGHQSDGEQRRREGPHLRREHGRARRDDLAHEGPRDGGAEHAPGPSDHTG